MEGADAANFILMPVVAIVHPAHPKRFFVAILALLRVLWRRPILPCWVI
jgi:hypothetical protein